MASMMSGCGFHECAVSLANYEGALLGAVIEKEKYKENNFLGWRERRWTISLSQFDDLYKLDKGVSF